MTLSTMALSTDIILFCSFLSLNLIIGLWAGTKVKSIREYAIGSKDFSTGTLTSTIIATCISGGFIGAGHLKVLEVSYSLL